MSVKGATSQMSSGNKVKFELKLTMKGNVCVNLEKSCCNFLNNILAVDETIIMAFQGPCR